MEVGPLARMVANYAAGQPDVKSAVDGALQAAKLQPQALYSTLRRVAIRGLEAKMLAACEGIGLEVSAEVPAALPLLLRVAEKQILGRIDAP